MRVVNVSRRYTCGSAVSPRVGERKGVCVSLLITRHHPFCCWGERKAEGLAIFAWSLLSASSLLLAERFTQIAKISIVARYSMTPCLSLVCLASSCSFNAIPKMEQSQLNKLRLLVTREPGLPIIDCARSCNNRIKRCLQLSAQKHDRKNIL